MTCLRSQGLTDSKCFAAPIALAADAVLALDRQARLDLRERGAEGVAVRLDGEIRQRLVAEFGEQDDLRRGNLPEWGQVLHGVRSPLAT